MTHVLAVAALLSTVSLVAIQNPSRQAVQTSAKQVVNAVPAPIGPYSHAVKAGGLIYVSGTLAQDTAGVMVGEGDVGAQTRRVIERMRDLLAAAGSSLDHVVSVTVYLKAASDFPAMNAAYRTFWPKDPPTRTTVVTDLVLPEALVELSMIAVPSGAERVVVHPQDWMASPNPYSYAIRTGDTLFLSGLVSRNGKDFAVIPGDIATQTRAVMDNAGHLLKAAGMSHANVVSARVYLPDVSVFQQMNDAYRSYFASVPPPARATVKAALAGSQYAVEITMIATSSRREPISDGRPANPNLSSAIRAGNRLYLSGMLGNTPDNRGEVKAQTGETLARIRRTLDAAGFSPSDVVDSIVYLTDFNAFGAMNEVYRGFFQTGFPARATVGVGLVSPDASVEIMMTAVKP